MKIPEGWKLVPVEADDAMVSAAVQDGTSAVWNGFMKDAFRKQYASALAAAPTPPKNDTGILPANNNQGLSEFVGYRLMYKSGTTELIDRAPDSYEIRECKIDQLCIAAPTPPSPSRIEFERLIKAQTPNAQLTRAENGEYIVHVIQTMWKGYCMATPPAREDSVKIPTGPEEAELMAKLGMTWLQQNAPERLKLPAQEAEPVASLTISHFRGHLENRELDYYGDLPDGTHKLYTRPANDKLRKAAEEMISKLAWMRQFLSYGHTQDIVRRELTEAGDNLRAALENK